MSCGEPRWVLVCSVRGTTTRLDDGRDSGFFRWCRSRCASDVDNDFLMTSERHFSLKILAAVARNIFLDWNTSKSHFSSKSPMKQSYDEKTLFGRQTFNRQVVKFCISSKFQVSRCSVSHWRKLRRSPVPASPDATAANQRQVATNRCALITRSWFHPSRRCASSSPLNSSPTARRSTWRPADTTAAAPSPARSHVLRRNHRARAHRQHRRSPKDLARPRIPATSTRNEDSIGT